MYVSHKVKGQSRRSNSDVKIYTVRRVPEDMKGVASFWISNVKFKTGFGSYCITQSVMQGSTLQICDTGPVELVAQIFTCHMFTFPLYIIEKQNKRFFLLFILIIWFALCSFASLPVILLKRKNWFNFFQRTLPETSKTVISYSRKFVGKKTTLLKKKIIMILKRP